MTPRYRFTRATYAYDGQDVWIPFPTREKPKQGARVTVACAMGYTVRIVNEALGIDEWRHVDDVYVREVCEEPEGHPVTGVLGEN